MSPYEIGERMPASPSLARHRRLAAFSVSRRGRASRRHSEAQAGSRRLLPVSVPNALWRPGYAGCHRLRDSCGHRTPATGDRRRPRRGQHVLSPLPSCRESGRRDGADRRCRAPRIREAALSGQLSARHNTGMHIRRSRYLRHRFPPEIISHAVWLYHRYCLSFRDVEDLLAERGIIVSYETIRQWCGKFGPDYARRLKRRQGRLGDTWFLDEVFVAITGQRQYLWRAVDQDGDLIDLLVQPRRDGRAARRFFRQLLKSQRQEPFRLVTDKLGSYRVAQRDVMPGVTHDTTQYANNRAEVSHQPTRHQERQMRGFTSPAHAQRFLHVHGVI